MNEKYTCRPGSGREELGTESDVKLEGYGNPITLETNKV